MQGGYDHRKIEKKWQKDWAKRKLYAAPDKARGRKNYYLLVEFPYPSGNLHVGHWYAFAVPDILARFKRMTGFNVLYPIGFDAFGLPAENAAIKNKLDPRKWTYGNIAHMKKQIASMGASFDWGREVITCDPGYYKWTQWQFLQFFKGGLAYRKETAVNWCPSCKTVLANEQVVDATCERCGTGVVQKQMLQWNLKITDYADRLIDDLAPLDWPEQIKESQRNWIGRSEGAEIDFPLRVSGEKKFTYVLLHGYQGSPNASRYLHWKAGLEKEGHRVIIPVLPHPERPSEAEQVEAALKAHSYDENTVLFGHSLGSVVAMKVLEKLQKPIARLVLAGGFVDRNFKDKPRNFDKRFSWKFDATAIQKNTAAITILHDVNDHAISERQLSGLENLLGLKAVRVAAQKSHFTGDREDVVLRHLRPALTVFTTRADTLFGATFLTIAPEHPWLRAMVGLRDRTDERFTKSNIGNEEEIERYIALAAKKSDLERQTNREKTGVQVQGIKAINPATGKEIPVFVADYVLGHYGTGAVMGVPAHDERDNEFARKYGLPIVEVVEPVAIRTSGVDAVRPEGEFLERRAVIAIVRRRSDGKFLCINYRPTGTHEMVSGGIEGNETPVETAVREIREETGYTDLEFVRELGGAVHSKYYSVFRKTNTHGHYIPLYFELKGDERVEVSESERSRHEVRWLSEEEVSGFLNRSDYLAAWHRYLGKAYEGEGLLTASGEFSRQPTGEAKTAIAKTYGVLRKTYKLRDWIVSRQRYWGVPIPVIHCAACGPVAVPEKELPVLLPKVKDYLPEGSGKSPLAKAEKFVQARCPQCKGKAERETDTLDTFVDSSWYFLRYTDPRNKKEFASRKKQNAWMPVDLYSGGAEHTTMHLLYSRFWHKAMHDLGLVGDTESYVRRESHGLVLGPDGQKMSKSRGNVLDPDEMVERLGADTVRLYLAFMGPYTGGVSYPWSPDAIAGMRRFLERVWRLRERVRKVDAPDLERSLNRTVKKVGADIAALKFNTAISQLMIFLNDAERHGRIGGKQWKTLLRLIAPFAPHMAEELWHEGGKRASIHLEKWPKYDDKLLQEDVVRIAVQVNGKTRGEVEVAPGADTAALEAAARGAVADRLQGKTIARTVVVPGRLVNFVVSE